MKAVPIVLTSSEEREGAYGERQEKTEGATVVSAALLLCCQGSKSSKWRPVTVDWQDRCGRPVGRAINCYGGKREEDGL